MCEDDELILEELEVDDALELLDLLDDALVDELLLELRVGDEEELDFDTLVEELAEVDVLAIEELGLVDEENTVALDETLLDIEELDEMLELLKLELDSVLEVEKLELRVDDELEDKVALDETLLDTNELDELEMLELLELETDSELDVELADRDVESEDDALCIEELELVDSLLLLERVELIDWLVD